MTETSKNDLVPALRDWLSAFMQESMKGFFTYAKSQNLSMSQFGAMFHVHRVGNCAVSDIGDDIGVTSAAASQMLERLVQQGLVRRWEDPDDRRVKRIELTELGNETIQGTFKARMQWFESLSETMSDSERRTAIAGLEILTRKTKAMETMKS